MGSGGFGAATNLSVGDGPFALTLGDFNADGHLDIVTANQYSNNISVLLGNGSGNFSNPINFAVGNHPVGVEIGDFNNDSKPDLAVTNYGSDNVSILLNTNDLPPIANNDTVTTNENTSLTFNPLTNDQEPDGDTLAIDRLETNNTQGIVTLNPDGTVTYNPSTAFNHLTTQETATDSFNYVVSDSTGRTHTATVTVTIAGINDAPTLNSFNKIGEEDSSITFTATDFSNAYSDPEDDNFTAIKLLSLPQNGTLTLNGTAVTANQKIPANELNSLIFTPNANYNGNTSFVWNASDGTNYSAGTTVNLIINPVNDSPVAVADNATTQEDTPISIDVLDNDTDPLDGDTLYIDTFDILSANGGTITRDQRGTPNDSTDDHLLYTPASGFSGEDTFNYTITDGQTTATATVTVTVDPVSNLTLFGTPNNDLLTGGNGHDVLLGFMGNDELRGGAGNDFLSGGDDNDTLWGEGGHDRLMGENGDDLIRGGSGNDFVQGGLGNDQLFGNDGDDILFGNSGFNLIRGDEGNDRLYGGDGIDWLLGDGGNDVLSGGESTDILIGGDGDDFLSGGAGIDELSGDGGVDTFLLQLGAGMDTIIDFQVGEDFLGLASGLTFGQLLITQVGNDTLISVNSSGESLATLLGVQASQISQGDFVLI